MSNLANQKGSSLIVNLLLKFYLECSSDFNSLFSNVYWWYYYPTRYPPPAIPSPETPITHPNLSLVSFSGNDPNQDATSFWNSVENKILFSLGTRPSTHAAQTSYDKRQQSLFGSLLTDTALEWFEREVTDATNWKPLKDEFIKRFTDGIDQFRFRLEVENTYRQEEKLKRQEGKRTIYIE